jgi:CIC family chloride channel protein
MRSPLTGVIFALELTHEWSALLPLVIATTTAYGLSALILKRSVLTEKVARKGFHITREYTVDPLEILFVREVMRTEFISFQLDTPLPDASSTFVSRELKNRHRHNRQGLYPVLSQTGSLLGVTTRRDMLDAALSGDERIDSTVANIMNQSPIVAYADETLRELAYRMADSRITHMPVVLRDDLTHLVGMVSQADLLKGRLLDLQEERDVERVLRIHRIIPFQLKTTVKR